MSFRKEEEEFIIRAASGDNTYVQSQLEDTDNNILFRYIPNPALSNAISCATRNGHLSIVKKLSSNLFVQESGGLSAALQTASGCGRYDIINLVLAKQPAIYSTKTFSVSIKNASQNGHENVVRLLISLANNKKLKLDLDVAIEASMRMEEWGIMHFLKNVQQKERSSIDITP